MFAVSQELSAGSGILPQGQLVQVSNADSHGSCYIRRVCILNRPGVSCPD